MGVCHTNACPFGGPWHEHVGELAYTALYIGLQSWVLRFVLIQPFSNCLPSVFPWDIFQSVSWTARLNDDCVWGPSSHSYLINMWQMDVWGGLWLRRGQTRQTQLVCWMKWTVQTANNITHVFTAIGHSSWFNSGVTLPLCCIFHSECPYGPVFIWTNI